jgi:hypothetical protein
VLLIGRKGSLSDHIDSPKKAKHLMPANGADSPSESSGANSSETANPPGPQRTKYSVYNGGAGSLLTSGGVL